MISIPTETRPIEGHKWNGHKIAIFHVQLITPCKVQYQNYQNYQKLWITPFSYTLTHTISPFDIIRWIGQRFILNEGIRMRQAVSTDTGAQIRGGSA